MSHCRRIRPLTISLVARLEAAVVARNGFVIRPRPEMDDTQLRPSAARFILSRSPKALSATALVGKTKELFSLAFLPSFPFHFDARCELPQKRWSNDAMKVVEMAPAPLVDGTDSKFLMGRW